MIRLPSSIFSRPFITCFGPGPLPPAKNLALSLLAIGLLTGAKASNLPLALPWLILLFLSRESLLKAPRAPILVAVLAAAAVSFLPVGLLNRYYTGDFFGDPTNQGALKITGPVGGVVGNLLLIATSNLAPPIWPHSISLDPFDTRPLEGNDPS